MRTDGRTDADSGHPPTQFPERGDSQSSRSPTRPFDTYLRVRHGQTAPRSFAPSLPPSPDPLDISRSLGGGNNWRYRHHQHQPGRRTDNQASEQRLLIAVLLDALNDAHAGKHHPSQANLAKHCSSLPLFPSWPSLDMTLPFVLSSSAEIFHFLFFSRSSIGGGSQTLTTGINQFIHPSPPLSLFSKLPWILSSASDCLRCSNDGDDGPADETALHSAPPVRIEMNGAERG